MSKPNTWYESVTSKINGGSAIKLRWMYPSGTSYGNGYNRNAESLFDGILRESIVGGQDFYFAESFHHTKLYIEPSVDINLAFYAITAYYGTTSTLKIYDEDLSLIEEVVPDSTHHVWIYPLLKFMKDTCYIITSRYMVVSELIALRKVRLFCRDTLQLKVYNEDIWKPV